MTESTDWFVPGGAYVTENRVIRLRPPQSWRRDIMEIPRVPPSMNSNKIRSHWHGFQTEKKSWQDEIGQLLMVAKVPRDNQRAIAGAFMRFPRRPVACQPRDPGNFTSLLNKALGDALVIDPRMPAGQRYIPDDDARHYFFGGVEFEDELGPPRTTIYIYWQPKQEE